MREHIDRVIRDGDGILRLDAALVARDWLPPGRRLGLDPEEYDVGERGHICERWLGSTTHADNRIGPADEGISHIRASDGTRLNLADAVAAAPAAIMGAEYAATHAGLGRLAKVYDFAARIPFHVHPPADQAALVGRRSKDESSYFPSGVDLGPHPETFFGLHPSLARARDGETLLEHLRSWSDDRVLKHAFAYQQIEEEGFFVESGVLHSPGTAVTIELQEDSDTLAMFQARAAGTILSKELLFKDVSDADRRELGEAALLRWIDWDANGEPDFYERRHLAPRVFARGDGYEEAWILYGSPKFSGKRLRLEPGARVETTERGVYNLLVWSGSGRVGAHEVESRVGQDELLIVGDAAIRPHEIVNTGPEELVIIKFFGPDLNPDAPIVPAAR